VKSDEASWLAVTRLASALMLQVQWLSSKSILPEHADMLTIHHLRLWYCKLTLPKLYLHGKFFHNSHKMV